MEGLGFGIIGCGAIAGWHGDALQRVKGATLVACTDVNGKSRETFALKYGILDYGTVEEMLENPSVHAVSICTPSGLHKEICLKAARAGKHIVVEKPMALTPCECDEIIQACGQYKVKLEVISQNRFKQNVRAVKKAVEEGFLGKIVTADIYMKYNRDPEYYKSSSWKGTWRMDGGGALMNQGIHGVDMLLYIMGDVKSVFGYARTLARDIEVEDTASAVLEFRNGAIGVIQGTTSVYPGYPRRLEINGDRGSVVLREGNIETWDVEGLERPQGEDVISGAHSDPMAFSAEGHVMQIQDLVDAVREDRRPYVDQHEGKRPVVLICAIYESSASGKRIDL
ncbi:MAG: Gfo/Idh/MocA family oxidoreductase [Clostridia bacterium]